MATGKSATMFAARLHETGGMDRVRIESVPLPTLDGDLVLIRIEAAGINPVDWKTRAGQYPTTLPMTLGHDFVGRVVALGPQAGDRFSAGERVYAMDEEGAFAEFASVPVAALAATPAGMSAAMAAAIPMAAITAWKALFEIAELKAGERVLIHGAGGAVGGQAAQLAKHKGAWVAATASGDDLARLRKWNLDLVIDYKSEAFDAAVTLAGGVDLVLDVIGGETRERSWAVLRDGGRMVSTMGATEPPGNEAARGIRGLSGWGAAPDGARLGKVTALFDGGALHVSEPKRFKLANTARAIDAAEHGHAGKVVIEIGQ